MEGYTKADWHAFRTEMIKLHGGQCSTCGRGEPEVVLQVHHKHYVAGRLPWQYGYEECEVLCRGCHAREHGLIAPRFGWRYLGDSDLGDLIGTCDLCGTALRYVFLVDHPQWPAMEVGTDCCDNLTDTKQASTLMESRRRYVSRLKTFVSSPRWKRGDQALRIRHQKIDLEVGRAADGFKLHVNGHEGKLRFPSLLEAKTAAFDLIESGKAAAFVKKKLEEARQKRLRQNFRPAW